MWQSGYFRTSCSEQPPQEDGCGCEWTGLDWVGWRTWAAYFFKHLWPQALQRRYPLSLPFFCTVPAYWVTSLSGLLKSGRDDHLIHHPNCLSCKESQEFRCSQQEGRELFRIRDNTGTWTKGYIFVISEFQQKMKDSCSLNRDTCTREAKGQTKSTPTSPNPNYLLTHTSKIKVWELMSEQFGFLQREEVLAISLLGRVK